MKLEPLIQLPGAWTGVADRFGVHVFQGDVSIADMDRMEAIGERWQRTYPGKRVELAVIFPSQARMSPEERKRMTQLIKHWEKERTASATVILADGMLGGMQRSILTGMLMLVPPPHPVKIFAAVPEAVSWLLPHIRALAGPSRGSSGAPAPEALGSEAVLAAVAQFCAAFEARSSS